MTISAIGGCGATQAQTNQYQGATRTSAASTTGTAAAQDGSTFINAIAGALSDIGVTSADAGTGGNDTTTDPAKAIGDFLHTLMEALHSKGGATGARDTGEPPTPPSGGKGGGVEADL